MRTAAHGLSIEVPEGWEARIVHRPRSVTFLHVASCPLSADAGQFGASVTARMGADRVFAALVEYPVDEQLRPGTGLFSAQWSPRLRLSAFGPAQLQVTRAGHQGMQRFFSHAGRPYCLYAVISPARRRPAELVGQLSAVLATLRFEPGG